MMDKQIEKFNEELQEFNEEMEELLNKIKQKQLQQYEYLRNKKLFDEISKLEECNVLQECNLSEDNIFVYFVNHRKIMNQVCDELNENNEINEYILNGGTCDHLRCTHKLSFNNVYEHNGFWCNPDCYHWRKHV